MLVAAFEIHHGVGAAVDLALDAGEPRKMHGILQHEGVRRARVEPDVEDVVDLLPVLVGLWPEETLARAVAIPGVGAFLLEGVRNALVDAVVLQDFGRAVALFSYEDSDWHAPGALPRQHPV